MVHWFRAAGTYQFALSWKEGFKFLVAVALQQESWSGVGQPGVHDGLVADHKGTIAKRLRQHSHCATPGERFARWCPVFTHRGISGKAPLTTWVSTRNASAGAGQR